jgi:hypothetical protein
VKHGIDPPPWFKDEDAFEVVVKELTTELESTDFDVAVISSEEFARLADHPRSESVIAELCKSFDSFDIEVLYYVRRPDEFLRSWYMQVNKESFPTRRFLDFCQRQPNSILDQSLTYRAWSRCVGQKKVQLRVYDETGSEVVSDFLAAIGVSGRADCFPQENLSYPVELFRKNRLAKIIQDVPIDHFPIYFQNQTLRDFSAFSELSGRLAQANHNYERLRKSGVKLETGTFNLYQLLKIDLLLNGCESGIDGQAKIYRDASLDYRETDAMKADFYMLRSLSLGGVWPHEE